MITRRAIFSLVTGTLVSPAFTCNLAPAQGSLRTQVLRAYKNASSVVLARVVDARFQNASTSPFGESPAHRAKLEVMEQWKGAHQPGGIVETTAPTSAGSCGVVLTPGETYLLYLHGREPYDVSLSTRDARIGDASRDIEILRDRLRKD